MRGAVIVLLALGWAFRRQVGGFAHELSELWRCARDPILQFRDVAAYFTGQLASGDVRTGDWLTLEGACFVLLVGACLLALVGGLVLFLSRRLAAVRRVRGYDDPVGTFAEDRLGRRAYVDMLVREIVKSPREASQVIGVYGAWGEGKTSVVRLAEEYCRQENRKDIRFVWFYPWASVDRKEINSELFNCIGHKLFGWRNPFVMLQFVRYACQKTVGWLPRPHGLNEIVVWLLAEVLNLFSSLDAVKRNLAKKLSRMSQRVVVVIDDLDRLERDEIRDVARCVKTNGDLPNVTYLLLTDEARFAKMLAPVYGDEKTGDGLDGAAFLEKIVPQPLPLWPVPAELLVNETEILLRATLSDAGLPADEIARDDVEFCAQKFCTLRAVKRLARTFGSNLSYYQAQAADRYSLDLHLGDCLRLTALRLVVPGAINRLYTLYAKKIEEVETLGPGLGLEIVESDYEAFVSSIDIVHRGWMEEFLRKTLMIEHRTVSPKSWYEPKGLRDRNMITSFRLAAAEHFARYFNARELPKVSISRSQMEAFVKALKKPDALDAWLKRTEVEMSVTAFLDYFVYWDYSLTSFSLFELVRGVDQIVAKSLELAGPNEMRRLRLVAAAQRLLVRHLERIKLETSIASSDCEAIADYLIKGTRFVVAEFLVQMCCYLVENELKVDVLKFDEVQMARLWEWLKVNLVGQIFDAKIENNPDGDLVGRIFNQIVLNQCATDIAFFKDHVEYLKSGMVFPKLIARLKTLGAFVRGSREAEDGFDFHSAQGLAFRKAYLGIFGVAEKELIKNFGKLSNEDLALVRRARVGVSTPSSAELDRLLETRR